MLCHPNQLLLRLWCHVKGGSIIYIYICFKSHDQTSACEVTLSSVFPPAHGLWQRLFCKLDPLMLQSAQWQAAPSDADQMPVFLDLDWHFKWNNHQTSWKEAIFDCAETSVPTERKTTKSHRGPYRESMEFSLVWGSEKHCSEMSHLWLSVALYARHGAFISLSAICRCDASGCVFPMRSFISGKGSQRSLACMFHCRDYCGWWIHRSLPSSCGAENTFQGL